MASKSFGGSSFDKYKDLFSQRNTKLESIAEENTGEVKKNITTVSSDVSIFPHIPIRFILMLQRLWRRKLLKKRVKELAKKAKKAGHTPSFGNLDIYNKEKEQVSVLDIQMLN